MFFVILSGWKSRNTVSLWRGSLRKWRNEKAKFVAQNAWTSLLIHNWEMANLKKSAPWNALNEEKNSLNRASVGKTYKFKISRSYDLTSDLHVGLFEDESSFLIQTISAWGKYKVFPPTQFPRLWVKIGLFTSTELDVNILIYLYYRVERDTVMVKNG